MLKAPVGTSAGAAARYYSPSRKASRRFQNLPNASKAPFAKPSTPWESQEDKDYDGACLRACGCVCIMLREVTACIQNNHATHSENAHVGSHGPRNKSCLRHVTCEGPWLSESTHGTDYNPEQLTRPLCMRWLSSTQAETSFLRTHALLGTHHIAIP